MWTIFADVQATRRKRFFIVVDEAGTLRYTTQRFGDALWHVLDMGQTAFRLDTGDRRVVATISPEPEPGGG